MTTIETYCSEDLIWVSKIKDVPDVGRGVNELCPFDPDVKVHVAHLVELMPNVGGRLNPGEIFSIQLKFLRLFHTWILTWLD